MPKPKISLLPQIEKGVPMPGQGGKGMRKSWQELLRRMEPGDSFIWPQKSISNIHVYARMTGVKICTRATDEGRRVWLVSKNQQQKGQE